MKRIEEWESEKSEDDLLKFIWQKSKSKENINEFLSRIGKSIKDKVLKRRSFSSSFKTIFFY